MLLDYLPLFVILIIAILIAFFVVGLGHAFGPKKPSERKSMPYESVMVPYGPGTRQMPVHFYLTAVLFILFDIEVIFLLPWVITFRKLGIPGFWLIIVFVVILEIAYIYAWKKGALEWD